MKGSFNFIYCYYDQKGKRGYWTDGYPKGSRTTPDAQAMKCKGNQSAKKNPEKPLLRSRTAHNAPTLPILPMYKCTAVHTE